MGGCASSTQHIAPETPTTRSRNISPFGPPVPGRCAALTAKRASPGAKGHRPLDSLAGFSASPLAGRAIIFRRGAALDPPCFPGCPGARFQLLVAGLSPSLVAGKARLQTYPALIFPSRSDNGH